MPDPFDFNRNKYVDIFDNMFGAGSYERTSNTTRENARLKAELEFAIKRAKENREQRNKYSKDKADYYDEQVRRGNIDMEDVPDGKLRASVAEKKMESIERMEGRNADVLDEVKRLGGPQDFGVDTDQDNAKMESLGAISNPNRQSPIEPPKKKKEKDSDNNFLEELLFGDAKSAKSVDRGGLLGFLDSTLGRASKGAHEIIGTGGELERLGKANPDNPIYAEQISKPDNILESGSELAGNLIGAGAYLIPGTQAVRGSALGARALGAGAKVGGKLGATATEGAALGGIFGAGQAAMTEATNPEERSLADHAKNIALEIGLGAVLDPAIEKIVGGVANAVRRRLIKPEQAQQIVEDEILALPEGQLQLPPGRTQNVEIPQGQPQRDIVSTQGKRVPNESRVKLQQFFNQLQDVDMPPGREEEYAEELWTQFAGPQDRNLKDTIDLAYPSRPKLSSSDIQRAKMRTVSGADNFNTTRQNPNTNFTMFEQRPLNYVGQNQPMNRMQVIKQLDDLSTPKVDQIGDLGTPKVRQTINNDPLGLIGGPKKVAENTDISRGFNYQNSRSQPKDELGESRFARLWNQFQKQFSDDTVYAKVIENTLKGAKRFRGGSQKLHRGLINTRGATSVAEELMNDTLLPAFNKVNKAGRNVETGIEYAYAKHFQDILKEHPDYVLPEGVTKEGIEKTVRDLKNDPSAELIRKSIGELFGKARQMLKESGRYSTKQIEKMESMYKNYAPLFRTKDFESPEAFERAMESFLSSTKPIRKLEGGSKDPIADPIQNITQSLQNMVYAAMRNNTLQNLADLAGKEMPNGKAMVKEVSDPSAGQNVVTVYFDGEPVHYNVQKELFDAIESTKGAVEPEVLMKWYQKATTLQRQAITYNPLFAVKSIVRDMPVGWVTSKAGWSVLRDLPQATADLFFPSFMRDKKNLREFYESGGGMNSIYMQDRKKFREIQNQAYQDRYKEGFVNAIPGKAQTQKIIRFILKHYQDFLENTEQLPKYTEYLAGKRKGLANEEAVFNARDTFDFMKSGRSIRKLNRYAAFINANIRGKEKYARSLAEKPLETMTKTVIAGGIPIGLAHASLGWATDEQRQRIEEAPDWMKTTHYLIAIPGTDQVLRLPKAHEVAATVDAVANFFKEQSPEEANKAWRDWFIQNVYVDPTLTPAVPVLEAGLNRDLLTGGQIIGYQDQNKRPIDQQDVYTSDVAKGLAGIANAIPITQNTGLASPKRIDHILKGLVPYTGEQVLTGIDRAIRPKGEEAPASMDIPLVPGALEQFIADPNQRSGLVDDLYNQRQQQRILKNEESPEFDEDRYKALNKLVKANQDLSREIREIDNSTNLTPKEKRTQRGQVIDELNAILREAKESGLLQ